MQTQTDLQKVQIIGIGTAKPNIYSKVLVSVTVFKGDISAITNY